MATSSFKSTTTRTSIGSPPSNDSTLSRMTSPGSSSTSSSSNRPHRRTRSLSRFSPRVFEPESNNYTRAPKGKFVNTKRGSEFTEISLDDLALELELISSRRDSGELREGRLGRRWASDTASSRRRGRSVSRQTNIIKATPEKNNSRGRRRSLSVLRFQLTDSESDPDISQSSRHQGKVKNLNDKSNITTSMKKATPNGRQLGRSLSQKHLPLLLDGYSSHSSASTDDYSRGSHMSKVGTEKTIQAVYAQKKNEDPIDEGSTELYETMRKELRHAVEEIRAELQQTIGRGETNLQEDKPDYDHVLSIIEQKYTTKVEQSEKRKQYLLAEIKLEEQQTRDLSNIIKEMAFSSQNSDALQKPAKTRLRSNGKNRMSNQMGEEAEKYIKDFASNVDDADSLFDGERSDASSAIGGTINEKDGRSRVEAQSYQSSSGSSCHPTGTDGVILPWLQWETSSDTSLSSKSIRLTPGTNVKMDTITLMHEPSSNNSKSICGSSSPGLFDACLETTKEDNSRSNFKESGGCKKSQFDMEEYRQLQMKEELLFERYKERRRIGCGGLLLCAGGL